MFSFCLCLSYQLTDTCYLEVYRHARNLVVNNSIKSAQNTENKIQRSSSVASRVLATVVVVKPATPHQINLNLNAISVEEF